MLSELYIENLAVIQKAEIPLTESFNVFTGETGAGKSILVGGINAVLGKRISRDMVRSGCEKATVSAMFRHLTPGTVTQLDRSQRVGEITRILGGEHITKTTLDNAAEQLDGQEKIYNEILNK